MGLLSKIRNVAALSTLGLSTACNYVPLVNERAVYGSEVGIVDGKKTPFAVPTINHSGYILSPHTSERVQDGELPLLFVPYKKTDPKNEETFLVKDRVTDEWGTWDLETPNVFVAAPYFSGEGDSRKPVTQIRYKDIVAEVSKRRDNPSLSVRNYTTNDLRERVPIISLDTDNNSRTPNEEFYAPRIVESGLTVERLLIPVAKTTMPIGTQSGEIRVRVKDDGIIYHLQELPTRVYNARPINNPVRTSDTNGSAGIVPSADVEIVDN